MTLLLFALSGFISVGFVFYRTLRPSVGCPVCGNPRPDLAAEPKLLNVTSFSVYHCKPCGKRFYQVGATLS